jgi:hypothetical protein
MHRISTAIVNNKKLLYKYLSQLSTIHIGYPLIHYSQDESDVDSLAGGGELSTVVHSAAALCWQLRGQKNFPPTYPRSSPGYQSTYPPFSPQGLAAVENQVENPWKRCKK